MIMLHIMPPHATTCLISVFHNPDCYWHQLSLSLLNMISGYQNNGFKFHHSSGKLKL